MRKLFTLLGMMLSACIMQGRTIVVADSLSGMPLPSASVFDFSGRTIGISDTGGRLPYISRKDLPVTVRYLGFSERMLTDLNADTIYLSELATELPEVLVASRRQKMLHVLAYVREYSTLSTYTDTVFLFREKMVDYMLPVSHKSRYVGWRNPRVIKSKSYYRFTDAAGTDSVSTRCNHHFSWSDWIGIVPPPQIPSSLKGVETGTDTLRGRFSPTEIWIRGGDRVMVDVDILADTAVRRWVPNLSAFFRQQLDFENFRVRFNCDNVTGGSIYPTDLAGYSFSIESNGRGHDMFRFNRRDEPFFVSTFAEVYIMDKEYITVKEAKKWEKRKFDSEEIDIIEPAEAPALLPAVEALIARVDTIDHDAVRLDFTPDPRLMARHTRKQNFGERAFVLLKQATGISAYRFHRNMNTRWRDFPNDRRRKNNAAEEE